jgi:NitT/TauT family transport system substrate-binding protein
MFEGWIKFARTAGVAAVASVAILAAKPADAAQIRVAFGDIASVEALNFLIALERTRERGVDVQTTFFKSEDLAAQAVVGGQADIGVGAPYALLQKVKAPIRLFFQLSRLRFYPVINTEFYKDWKDLDGQEFAVHSRGSGTEAIMMLMQQREGFKLSRLSYIPGAEVRAGALLQGNVKATIVDTSALKLIESKGGGKFKILEIEDVDATDEALFANTKFLDENAEAVGIMAEELIKTWREINKDPTVVTKLRAQYKLLPDLPKDLEGEVEPYFVDSVKAGVFPDNGGSEEDVREDFAFFTISGQLKGTPEELKVEDFWTFAPLKAALAKVGTP